MTDDKLVDLIAQALAIHRGYHPDKPEGGPGYGMRKALRMEAASILSVVREYDAAVLTAAQTELDRIFEGPDPKAPRT